MLHVNGHFLNQRLTGVQRYALEVLRGFDRAGYSYQVEEPSPFFASQKITQQFWEQFLLPHQKESDSVLWSPTNTGPVYADNHVITLHDIGVFPHPEWFSKSYVRWKRLIIPRIVKKAKGVLTVSKFSKNVISEYLNIPSHKINVVYNGVDTDHFQPASQQRINGVIAKYDISTPYVLALGSLDPRKNFSRLIDAWKKCVSNDGLKNYQLVIAGGGNSNFSTFKAKVDSDTVHFLGYVEDQDLPPLYSGAQAFLFPSLFEGFGLPVIEAMACGTAVLTSATTALGEIAGDAAIAVDPENTDAIHAGIMELLESPVLRTTLVERGLERIALFNWDHTAKQIYRILTS